MDMFSLLQSLTLQHDPGTSDDSGRASERLTTSSVAPRDADSSRDRLSDVSISWIRYTWRAFFKRFTLALVPCGDIVPKINILLKYSYFLNITKLYNLHQFAFDYKIQKYNENS